MSWLSKCCNAKIIMHGDSEPKNDRFICVACEKECEVEK